MDMTAEASLGAWQLEVTQAQDLASSLIRHAYRLLMRVVVHLGSPTIPALSRAARENLLGRLDSLGQKLT